MYVCVNVYVCVCVDVVVCVMAWLASICVMFAPENGHGPKSQLGRSSFSGGEVHRLMTITGKAGRVTGLERKGRGKR